MVVIQFIAYALCENQISPYLSLCVCSGLIVSDTSKMESFPMRLPSWSGQPMA